MIIKSLLDTDLYKFTMMQVVLHRYPSATATYRFKCRTPNINLTPFVPLIEAEIEKFCQLQFQEEELDYLAQLGYFKTDFIDYLRHFRLNKQYIHINVDQGFELTIQGPWLRTILFEVPILAIISEIYANGMHSEIDFGIGRQLLADKIDLVKRTTLPGQFKFTEFGTRRRFSFAWQEYVIDMLQKNLPDNIVGTSNVLLAKRFRMQPIGTMAHEYVQAFQALAPNLLESQRLAFTTWHEEYQDKLEIALADTYTLDIFLRDFDEQFCRLYDGVRQDSGDPFYFAERMLHHYRQNHIDPLAKTIVFSDALTFPLAIALHQRFNMHVNTLFGIGTNLTNDMGFTPIQIVIKLVGCNGKPVAKISDSPDKTISGDDAYTTYLKHALYDLRY